MVKNIERVWYGCRFDDIEWQVYPSEVGGRIMDVTMAHAPIWFLDSHVLLNTFVPEKLRKLGRHSSTSLHSDFSTLIDTWLHYYLFKRNHLTHYFPTPLRLVALHCSCDIWSHYMFGAHIRTNLMTNCQGIEELTALRIGLAHKLVKEKRGLKLGWGEKNENLTSSSIWYPSIS